MSDIASMRPCAARRAVLAMGAAGAAAALTGCTVYGADDDPPPPPPPPPEDGDDGDGDGEDGGNDDGGGGTPVVGTADVPVGGGVIEAGVGVVVTQPSEGEFKAFSSTCTHQGCTVSDVADELIQCACHGSRFSIADGSVVQAAQGLSPADQDPLPEVGIVVDDDTVSLP